MRWKRAQRFAAPWRSALLSLVACVTLLAGCGEGPPQVIIISPLDGSFSTAASVQVTGILANIDPADIADVRVNGVSALPLDGSGAFMVTVPLDGDSIVNPIVAEVVGNGGSLLRDRVTVLMGDSVADGGFSLEGIALRLTQSGLDQIEPLITSMVPLDLASLVPPGTLVVDNFCYQDTIFGCLGRVDATISGSPAPSLSGFDIDVDPMNGFVAGDVTLYDLFFRANVVAVTGIGFSCTVDVSANSTSIIGDFDMSPHPVDPSQVDVTQLGNVGVFFSAFNDSTNCGGFLGFIVEFFIDLFVSDLQNDLVRPGLEGFLNTLDANGNTPVAGAFEQALDAVEISGPIGEALGVGLETPLFEIFQDSAGVTLGSDARILAALPNPDAVDLTASYELDETFPIFDPLAPNAQPYDMGLCVSTSTFNQLLKAETESGLLISTVTDFDFGNGPVPIRAALLGLLLPKFQLLDPNEILQFEIRPTLAPIMDGQPGPLGELATVEMGQLNLRIVPVASPDTILLEVAVDARLGIDLDFAGGGLSFSLTPPAAEDLDLTLLENPLLLNPTTLDNLLPNLIGLVIPVLTDSLGSFPLPEFLGLQLTLVDIDRNGEYMSLFFDLTPAP